MRWALMRWALMRWVPTAVGIGRCGVRLCPSLWACAVEVPSAFYSAFYIFLRVRGRKRAKRVP